MAGAWHCAHAAFPGARSFDGVRIVAIAAGDALLVHAALGERAVVVHLVPLLAVGPVEAGLEERDAEALVDGVRRRHGVGELRATGMASGARLDLAVGAARRSARWRVGAGAGPPRGVAAFVEAVRETIVAPQRADAPRDGPPTLRAPSPLRDRPRIPRRPPTAS